MNFSDLAGKAKEALKGNEDKVNGGLDQAGQMITNHTPDAMDGQITSGIDKAKDAINSTD